MVLLITGHCEGSCWYCPLSEEKKGKDVIYADEMLSSCRDDVIKEAHCIDALGTGITGGDPLLEDETFECISELKASYGPEHHIHLYTQITDIDKIRRACQMGLDEIRFHPPLDVWGTIEDTEYPLVIKDLKKYEMDVGIEIPAIPSHRDETYHLLEILGPSMDFINLNELEFSATNWKELVDRGFTEKSDESSAVSGSQEFALELLEQDFGTSLHYCSASFKDGVQMRNRIMRRARRVANNWEIITDDGTLVKGIICCGNPEKMVKILLEEYDVPTDKMRLDVDQKRIEIYLPILEEIAPLSGAECYGIEVYPTADALEVERWPVPPIKR